MKVYMNILCLLFCIFISISWIGDDLAANKRNKLDYVLVEYGDSANFKRYIIKNGSELRIFRGEKFKIISAALIDNSRVDYINFVGFKGVYPNYNDDRARVIDTAKNILVKKWSKGGLGLKYALTVGNKDMVQGVVYIKFIEPHLKYVVLKINGKEVISSNEEVLSLNFNDKIKVKEVVTNLSNDKDVTFKIVKTKSKNLYKMNFIRNGVVFSNIKIKIKINI